MVRRNAALGCGDLRVVKEGDVFDLGGIHMEILETPGSFSCLEIFDLLPV